MKNSSRWLQGSAVLLLTGTLLTACSSGLELEIHNWLREDLDISSDMVSCPSIFGRVFRDFSCLGKAEGGEIRIQVFRGMESLGRFRVESGLVNVSKVETAIEEKVFSLTGEFSTVACGKRFRVSVPGSAFSCVVHDPRGETHLADVTIEDTQGTFRARLDEPTR